MPNLSALTPITTSANALSNLILVSPQKTIGYQPQNPDDDDGETSTDEQPPALLFDYEGEQTVTAESDITDHYVEDNTARQDHIALKPVTITVHGFIGDLNDVVPNLLAPIKFIADKLTVLTAYTPELTTTAQIAYATAFQLYQTAAKVLNSAVAAWNTITGQGGLTEIGAGEFSFELNAEKNQTPQQKAFQQFYGYYTQRALFTVQTPWAVFKDMAIKSIRAIQDAETRVMTDFEVTFKMIRKASTTLLDADEAAAFLGQAKAQASKLSDLGISSPTPSISLDSAITTMLG